MQLQNKSDVWIDYWPRPIHTAEGFGVRHLLHLHQVGNEYSGGSRDSCVAVHQQDTSSGQCVVDKSIAPIEVLRNPFFRHIVDRDLQVGDSGHGSWLPWTDTQDMCYSQTTQERVVVGRVHIPQIQTVDNQAWSIICHCKYIRHFKFLFQLEYQKIVETRANCRFLAHQNLQELIRNSPVICQKLATNSGEIITLGPASTEDNRFGDPLRNPL